MRIRVPGRFVAVWAILVAFLCLLPASTNVAVARPISWNDVGPPTPPPGDNDGIVLKSRSAPGSTTEVYGGKTVNATTLRSVRSDFGSLRLFFAVTKLDYWLFWVR